MVLSSGKGMKMKVQKYEIARVIDKLKSIVQKNDQFPALGGILVKDGYLIASNSEITMKVKLEASEGSYFIIPMKAFDLIKNLPDGEIDISATDKNVVMIKIGAIKNKYQSYPPEEFNFDITEDPEADGVELNGKKIMEAISHVIYAAADGGANTQMTGIYFEGTDSGVSLAALDGHVVAVDSVKAEGAKDMKLIVPKAMHAYRSMLEEGIYFVNQDLAGRLLRVHNHSRVPISLYKFHSPEVQSLLHVPEALFCDSECNDFPIFFLSFSNYSPPTIFSRHSFHPSSYPISYPVAVFEAIWRSGSGINGHQPGLQ